MILVKGRLHEIGEILDFGFKQKRRMAEGISNDRMEEIYQLVLQVIRESGYEEVLSSGIVITGGSAVMPGMVELGEDIFLKPVRRGLPQYRAALADMVLCPLGYSGNPGH